MYQNYEKVKVFALPFGGGSKYSYRALEQLAPGNFDWETIELPGRGTRSQEPLLTDIHAMTEDIFKQIRSRLYNLDYLLFGHSMGALLVYELTKRICSTGLTRPNCLFLTGREAPNKLENQNIADKNKDAFWQEIEKMGGLSKEILDNDELKDFFEPILRADFKAIEGYVYKEIIQPLPVPVFIRYGNEEDYSAADIDGWQKETVYPLDVQVLPGDHFFIFQQPAHLIMQMTNAYSTARKMLYQGVSKQTLSLRQELIRQVRIP